MMELLYWMAVYVGMITTIAFVNYLVSKTQIALDSQKAIKIGAECERLIKKLNGEFEELKAEFDPYLKSIDSKDLKKAVYEFDDHKEWLEKLIAASKKKEELVEAIRELRWDF